MYFHSSRFKLIFRIIPVSLKLLNILPTFIKGNFLTSFRTRFKLYKVDDYPTPFVPAEI
jgi:hypothetical protein